MSQATIFQSCWDVFWVKAILSSWDECSCSFFTIHVGNSYSVVSEHFIKRNENLIFFFLNQNICCGYSKEPSQ